MLPLHYPGVLHIVLFTPLVVNSLTSTLTLGATIEHGIPMFLVTLTHLPRHNGLHLDDVPARASIVVVVEGDHTIVHFRVDKKLCLR